MRNHFLKVGRGKLGNASIVGSSGTNTGAGYAISFASDAISGAVSGDVAIVFCYKAEVITMPVVSGWTRLYYAETGTSFGVYTKTLTNSDVSFTVAFGDSHSGSALMVLCRGVDGSAITGNHIFADSEIPNPPSASGFEINDICLVFGSYKYSAVAYYLTPPTGYTLAAGRINITIPSVAVSSGFKKITSSGAEDPPTFTDGGLVESSRAVTLRLPSL